MIILPAKLVIIGLLVGILPVLSENQLEHHELANENHETAVAGPKPGESVDGSAEALTLLRNRLVDKRYRLQGKRSADSNFELDDTENDMSKRYRLMGKRLSSDESSEESNEQAVDKRYRLMGKRYRLMGKRYRLMGKREFDSDLAEDTDDDAQLEKRYRLMGKRYRLMGKREQDESANDNYQVLLNKRYRLHG